MSYCYSNQRHAVIYFVGSNEIDKDKSLADCDGIHVVCSTSGGSVLTAYRNKVFTEKRYSSGQRPRRGRVKSKYGK